jgi:hypothetical protein
MSENNIHNNSKIINPVYEKNIHVNIQESVYYTHCIGCNQAFKNDEVVVSVSQPFCCLLHKGCYPFYDFARGWPHKMPMQYYQHASSSLSK